MNKYEQLIEFIINEQEDKARELFHRLVVEKSRDIYESLIDEDDLDEGLGGNPVTGLVNDIEHDENGMHDSEDEFASDDTSDADINDDEMDSDDMGMGMDQEEQPVEDRVMDLENELEQLKADFEQLMAGEEHEEQDEPGIHGDMDSMGSEFDDEEEDNGFPQEGMVREYVEKVAMPSNRSESGSTVGTGGDTPTVNKQSIVAGKNSMGGTAANIVHGGTEQAADGKPVPTPSNQYTKNRGQLPGAGTFQNVPGAKTKGYTNKATSYEKQHGAEGQTTDGKVPVTSKSVVGGKIR